MSWVTSASGRERLRPYGRDPQQAEVPVQISGLISYADQGVLVTWDVFYGLGVGMGSKADYGIATVLQGAINLNSEVRAPFASA